MALPGTAQRYRLGASSFAFSAANGATSFAIQCELAGLHIIVDHGITLAVAGLPQRGLNRDCLGRQIGQQMIGSHIDGIDIGFATCILAAQFSTRDLSRLWSDACIIVFGVRCPRCQEQCSDTGYEETGHRGLGFIFRSIRSAHFSLAMWGNFAQRGNSIALVKSPLQCGALGHRLQQRSCSSSCSSPGVWTRAHRHIHFRVSSAACAVPVARSSAAIPDRSSFITQHAFPFSGVSPL
jgi:hypothetical protein